VQSSVCVCWLHVLLYAIREPRPASVCTVLLVASDIFPRNESYTTTLFDVLCTVNQCWRTGENNTSSRRMIIQIKEIFRCNWKTSGTTCHINRVRQTLTYLLITSQKLAQLCHQEIPAKMADPCTEWSRKSLTADRRPSTFHRWGSGRSQLQAQSANDRLSLSDIDSHLYNNSTVCMQKWCTPNDASGGMVELRLHCSDWLLLSVCIRQNKPTIIRRMYEDVEST